MSRLYLALSAIAVTAAPACVVREIHHYPAQVHCDGAPGQSVMAEPAPVAVTTPPPTYVDVDERGPAPLGGCWFWTDPYSHWTGTSWVWIEGRYNPCVEGLVWVAAASYFDGGWYYLPGHYRHRGSDDRDHVVYDHRGGRGGGRVHDHRGGGRGNEDVPVHPGARRPPRRDDVTAGPRREPVAPVAETPDRPWRDRPSVDAAASPRPAPVVAPSGPSSVPAVGWTTPSRRDDAAPPPRSAPAASWTPPGPPASAPPRPAPPPARSWQPSGSAPSRSEPPRSAPAPSRPEPPRSAPAPSRPEPARSAPAPSRSEPSRSEPSRGSSGSSRSSESSSRGSDRRR